MSLIWGLVLSVVATFIASKLVSGVQIKTITAGVILSLAVAVGGYFLQKGVMFFLAPFNWITLGLLGLIIGVVIKAVIVRYMDKKVEGFEVSSFGTAVTFCIVVSLVQMALSWIF
jgi:putative membrane protein